MVILRKVKETRYKRLDSVIPLWGNIQNSQIPKDRKQLPGSGEKEIESDCLTGMKFSLGDEENVLEPDSGNWLHETSHVLNITELYILFTMAKFMCVLPQSIIHCSSEIQI